MAESMGWDEAHGYTAKCRNCGQTGDSTYCSARCESEDAARERAEAEDEEEEEDADEE